MTTDPDSPTASDEQLVERVRKLVDKSRGTDNVHEAEAFAAKAAELAARHRIDPERLARAERRADDGEQLAIREVMIGRGAYARGRLALLVGIARAHDVEVVFQAQQAGTVAFLAGHRADLDVVEVMYASLHHQAAAHMNGLRRSTGAATQRERRSFLFGFAQRIGELLAESRRRVEEDRRAHVGAEAGASMDLVLLARRDRVTDYARSEWGRVRSASPVAPVTADGWRKGTAAAERADVGRSRLPGRRALRRGN